MNDCFVPVVVDAEKNRAFISSIGVKALPTTVIIAPDLQVVQKITGFKSAKDLDVAFDRICQEQD